MISMLFLSMVLSSGQVPDGIWVKAGEAGKNVVHLSFWFGRDEMAIPGREKNYQDKLADLYYAGKQSFLWTGIVINHDGTVVCADPCIPLSRVTRIKADLGKEKGIEFCVDSILIDYGGLLLKPKQQLKRPVSCIEFSKPSFELGDRFYRLRPMIVSRDKYLQLIPGIVDLLPLDSTKYRAYNGIETKNRPYIGCLLLNDCGDTVGFQVEYDLWDGPGGLTTYNPEAIKSGKRFSMTEWNQLKSRIGARVQKSSRKLRFYFRNIKEDKDEDNDGIFSSSSDSSGEDKKIITRYGIAIPGNYFFVPVELNVKNIKRIIRIALCENGVEKEVPFVGKFKKWGGLLVGGANGVEKISLDVKACPQRGKLFLVHTITERFGKIYQETDYNRYYNIKIGALDEEFISPVKEMNYPSMLFDMEGKLLGFYLGCLSGQRSGDEKMVKRTVCLKEIAGDLLSPRKAFDSNAVPDPKKRVENIVWLGVEIQGVNKSLMELMGDLGPTREGKIGLLVNHVYRDSPASKIGIEDGDILLSVQEKEKDNPIEFVSIRGWNGRSYYRRMFGGEFSFSRRSNPAFWKSRRNLLTKILTKIGPGKEVILRWLKKGKEKKSPLVLEEGPPDFESVKEYKARPLGIVVKELTYEVRDVLRLSPGAPGLVICKVEPGSKADVGRLNPFEILTHVNGKPLKKIADLKTAIESVKGDGKATFVLRAWMLGKSRIVTIEIGE